MNKVLGKSNSQGKIHKLFPHQPFQKNISKANFLIFKEVIKRKLLNELISFLSQRNQITFDTCDGKTSEQQISEYLLISMIDFNV